MPDIRLAFGLATLIMPRSMNLSRLVAYSLVVACTFGSSAVRAQQVHILHEFQNDISQLYESPTGRNPDDGLTLGPDGNFYGVTSSGGQSPTGYADYGVVYRMTPDGEVTVLHTFTNSTSNLQGGLTVGADGHLYGVKGWDAFRITLDGELTYIAELEHSVNDKLTLASDGNFYGLVAGGVGSIFRMTHEGEVTTLYEFAENQYGVSPRGALVEADDGKLYGVTYGGGDYLQGSIFRISKDGNYELLYSFNGSDDYSKYGVFPYDGLVKGPDGYLYGTTNIGGQVEAPHSGPKGVIFRISTDGEYSIVHSFYTWTEGMPCNCGFGAPYGGLLLASDGNFYGVASGGFALGGTTVYKMSPDGLVSEFAVIEDGEVNSMLVEGKDGHLYGVTSRGGADWAGTIFRIEMPDADPQPKPTWKGFPIDETRSVDTGAIVGWLYAPGDDGWAYSWDLDRWIYFADATEAGMWSFFPAKFPINLNEEPGEKWSIFPIDEGGNVDTQSILGWILIMDSSGWVFSWDYTDWFFAPETSVSEYGAWIYLANT